MRRKFNTGFWLLLLAVSVARADHTIAFPGSPWTWRVFAYTNDLWIRSFSNSVAQFDFRIGGGGCIAEMRACYLGFQPLLCPEFVNSAQPGRDNVLQWVLWAGATMDGTTDAGTNWFKRWNVNQAGGYDGFAPVSSVTVSATTQSCAIEVQSQNDEQFLAGYDDIFRSNSSPDWVSQMVRYDLLDKGVLKITHAVLIPTVHRTNTVVAVDSTPGDFRYAYFENWSTFYASTNGLFDGLARHLAADGTPDWWFRFFQNIPVYEQDSVTNTAGYAVVFNIGGDTNGSWPVVGVVFGIQDMVKVGNTGTEATAVMNFFEAQGGDGLGYIAILPAGTQNLPVPGSTVVYETYLVPRAASSADFVNDLDQYATVVSPPTIYAPGHAPAAYTNLTAEFPWAAPQNTQRVENLAPLAVGLGSPIIGSFGLTQNVFYLSGSGPAGQGWRMFATTNLTQAFSNWAQVGTGSFAGGGFQFSNTVANSSGPTFYRLVTP